MNAVISGRAGVALLVEGDTYRAFEAEAPDDVFSCAASDYHRLFVHVDDVEFLTGVELDDVRATLQKRVAREDALDYVLYLLDPELRDETRRDAAADLNQLLTDAETAEWVEDILFAKPLPDSADTGGAWRLCTEADATVTADFVSRLVEHQDAVTAVREAWERIPDSLFERLDGRREFEGRCIDLGLFRRFAITLNSGASLDSTDLQALKQAEINANVKQISDFWISVLDHRHRVGPLLKDLQNSASDAHLQHSKRRAKQFRNRRKGSDKKLELQSRIQGLTSRERQIMELLIVGMSSKEIARRLGTRRKIVEDHCARIMAKMKARDVAHLIHLNAGQSRET